MLAEPGAGKTSLLDSVAERLGVTRARASTVRPSSGHTTLVVDAFDEVARIGEARVHNILDKIRDVNPDKVLLSSRSSEWEEARTRLVEDLFGCKPLVVRLVPLDEGEQRQLFEHWHPDRAFDAFHADIRRFDLQHLLGNPEFLRLFASAYDEANGKLTSRSEVFPLAIQNLARESNPDVMANGTPTGDERIDWANEVFAKLLLSGADGLAVSDIAEDAMYPQLHTIGLSGDGPHSIFGTKLFRPGVAANRHEPVHRIVAEYAAARHLARLIDEPSHRLTITQCLALIAPNGTARDDLRGLLGWMAALGSQVVQDAVIALDPYAVLSNGDPSKLTVASRIALLDALKLLNADDPYFRRGDVWRSFSAFSFFTSDIADEVRPIINTPDSGQLRNLILELLIGSPAVASLSSEIQEVMLDESVQIGPRFDALSCLLGEDTVEPAGLLRHLIDTGTVNALRLASEILMHMGDNAPYDLLKEMLEKATGLYPTKQRDSSHTIGERYFLKPFIQQIDLVSTARLLDELTAHLRCTCGKQHYKCYCREGVSKIVGLLLDNYFERVTGPHDPDQVWQWMRNLHFHGRMGTEQSPAVAALQGDDGLRRALQRHALYGLTSRDEIVSVFFDTIGDYGHSGLHQKAGDARYLVDFAYDTDNPTLWSWFTPQHYYYRKPEERGPDDLRRHCRAQARDKPLLMREWARMNRRAITSWKESKLPRFRLQSRRRRKQQKIIEANTAVFHQNRAVIERGEHVSWTHEVARSYLHFPDRLSDVTHDLFDADTILRNSLTALGGRCPSIEEIGQGNQRVWTTIFLAGAVAEFRATRSLEVLSPQILRTILPDARSFKTDVEDECEAFLEEVRRYSDLTSDSAETYARAYFEPSLAAGHEHINLYILDREPVLNHLRASLTLEWLQRFPDLPIHTLETLFEMAARYGDREALLALIRERCIALDDGVLPHPQEIQRPFWFLRDFWFAEEIDENVWAFMARNRNMIFSLESRRYRGRTRDEIWTPLSAPKIERILLTYLPKWPAVPLPSSWGTGSPKGETAYRYLRDVVWQIGRDDPAIALPVVETLLAEAITTPSHNDLRSIRADLRRKAALTSTRSGPVEIAAALDGGSPASVEQLRALVLELLAEMQKDVHSGDTGIIDQFYDGGKRLGEVRAMSRIAAWLKPRLASFGIHEVVEHQLNERNRCDLTATRMVAGRPRMLVVEGKGQWHQDLFTAAKTQLADRYAMHPNADEQGVFLVVWYGSEEKVANVEEHKYATSFDLYEAIEKEVPDGLKGRLDVFVLDVSRGH